MDEAELLDRAETIQDRHQHLVEQTLDALIDLINDIKSAREGGTSDAQLEAVLEYQRQASFYVDWVEADNKAASGP